MLTAQKENNWLDKLCILGLKEPKYTSSNFIHNGIEINTLSHNMASSFNIMKKFQKQIALK